MQKTVSIAIGVLILILLVASFSYQLGKKQVVTPPEISPAPAISVLEKSKVIQNRWASARGEVTEIKDRTLTLTAEGETLSIPIKEGAEIIKMVTVEGKVEAQLEEIEFKEIKVGDKVVVQIDVLAGEKLEGRGVTVLP